MKKLFLLISLIVSSFFFSSIVNADEVAFGFNWSFDKLNDSFYTAKGLYEEKIVTDSLSTDYCAIYYNSSLIFVPISVDNYPKFTLGNSITVQFRSSGANPSYKYVSGSFSNYNMNWYINSVINNPILYCTRAIAKVTYNSTNIYRFTYEDYEFLLDSSSETLLTLTELKSLYDEFTNVNVPDPHQEEKDILISFYDLCISKLSDLATVIVSNYIYLSIIVIFIFIFVFEIIRRKFL